MSKIQALGQAFGWARSAWKIFPIMGQRYSFHFRVFEKNKGKKIFFSDKKQKKKRFWILFPEDFLVGIFSLYDSPIRTPVRVF